MTEVRQWLISVLELLLWLVATLTLLQVLFGQNFTEFFGIDIVGNKLMEINVFSPGGLNVMGQMYKVDFATEVIKSLEKKVYYNETYQNYLFNSRLATL